MLAKDAQDRAPPPPSLFAGRPSRERHPIAWAFYPVLYPALAVLERKGLKLYRQVKFDPKFRSKGMEWPVEAETMIGLKRLDNLHACIETVISDQIPGDLIETGVWRGGPAFSCAPR
jgi:hypothetical protein